MEAHNLKVETVVQPDWTRTDKREKKAGCLIVIPSRTDASNIAWWPSQFGISLSGQQIPINFSICTLTIENQEIGDARNAAVKYARQIGAEYIFFRDNDTLATPDSLSTLFSLRADIAGGIYYAKQWPSEPLVFKYPQMGGYKNWRFGDVIECDAIGMGCCLVKTAVFDKIPEPWFRTVRGAPELGGDIAFDWAEKQMEGILNPDAIHGDMTEDIYFCLKAKRAGFKVYAHAGVQCAHLDTATGCVYGFEAKFGDVVKITPDRRVWFHPPADHPYWKPPEGEIELKREVVKFDLGAGGGKLDGYIAVDLFDPQADEQCDATDLRTLVEKYGRADEIRASHLLEHLPHVDTMRVLRNWVWALKSGGLLSLAMPDLEWCLRNWLDKPESDPLKYGFWLWTIYGSEETPGQYHKAGFTKDLLELYLSKLDLEDIRVWTEMKEEYSHGQLFAEARKKADPCGLPSDPVPEALDAS